jgi:2-dehydropantoate 2-reductase
VHSGLGAINFGIVPDPLGKDFEASVSDAAIPWEQRKLNLDDITRPGEEGYDRLRTLRSTVEVLQALQNLHASWLPMSHIQVQMRKKLVVNAIINPLTMIMGCRNGDILKTDYAANVARQVCQEAAAIFEAQYERTVEEWLQDTKDGDRDQLPVGRMPEGLSRDQLVDECVRVAELTAGNISSMLADVRRNRPTEIDFINGHLVKLGAELGISTPANKMLVNLVKMRSIIPLDQFLG